MKKYLALTAVVQVCLAAVVVQAETWTFASARYSILNESAGSGGSGIYGQAASINFSVEKYLFSKSESMGLFIHTRLIVPRNGRLLTRQTSQGDFEYCDTYFGLCTMLGPGFHFKLGDGIDGLLGVGPSLTFVYGSYTGYVEQVFGPPEIERLSFWTVTIGIGSDIGVEVFLTPAISVKTGTGITVNFANYGQASTYNRIFHGWSTHYVAVELSPYLGVGLSL